MLINVKHIWLIIYFEPATRFFFVLSALDELSFVWLEKLFRNKQTPKYLLLLFVCFRFREFLFSSQQQMIKKLTLDAGGFCVMKTRNYVYLSRQSRGESFVRVQKASDSKYFYILIGL